jgi:hypothetical protein
MVPDSVPPETWACSAAGKAIAASKIIAAMRAKDSISRNLREDNVSPPHLEAERSADAARIP